MTDWSPVAEAVRRRRAELGLSQRAAADIAGISPTTWGQLEKHAAELEPLTLAKICRALGWSLNAISEILNGEEPTILQPPPPAPTSSLLTGEEQGQLAALQRLAGEQAARIAMLEAGLDEVRQMAQTAIERTATQSEPDLIITTPDERQIILALAHARENEPTAETYRRLLEALKRRIEAADRHIVVVARDDDLALAAEGDQDQADEVRSAPRRSRPSPE